jgi:phosphoenolpyruvate carboxylase
MTKQDVKPTLALAKEAFESDQDGLKELFRMTLQQVLEAEMTELLGAGKSERTGGRQGYRSGYYERDLITRLGKIELRIPQDRQGKFSTELFERYARSEKALLSALAEMYVQGVSARKVKAITELHGSMGFDGAGTYTKLVEHKLIENSSERECSALRISLCPRGVSAPVGTSGKHTTLFPCELRLSST